MSSNDSSVSPKSPSQTENNVPSPNKEMDTELCEESKSSSQEPTPYVDNPVKCDPIVIGDNVVTQTSPESPASLYIKPVVYDDEKLSESARAMLQALEAGQTLEEVLNRNKHESCKDGPPAQLETESAAPIETIEKDTDPPEEIMGDMHQDSIKGQHEVPHQDNKRQRRTKKRKKGKRSGKRQKRKRKAPPLETPSQIPMETSPSEADRVPTNLPFKSQQGDDSPVVGASAPIPEAEPMPEQPNAAVNLPSRGGSHGPSSFPDTTTLECLPASTDSETLHGDSQPEGKPISLLCSEVFLETWNDAVARLASGDWSSSSSSYQSMPSASRNICMLDTALLDACNVDIEIPSRGAIIVVALSAIMNGQESEHMKGIVDLVATSRYRQLEVLLCVDVELNTKSVSCISRLQNADSPRSGDFVTVVSYTVVSPRSLPTYIGEFVVQRPIMSSKTDEIEKCLADDRTKERLLFLLAAVPTLSVGGALHSLLSRDQSPQPSSDLWFMRLFSETPVATGNSELHPHSMQQLAFATNAVLGQGNARA